MHRLPTASRGGPIGWLLTLLIAALPIAAPAAATLAVDAPACAAESAPGGLPEGLYRLEPQRSQLTATLRFLGVTHYPVTFSRMSGRVEMHRKFASAPRVAIRIDPHSIGNPRSGVSRTMLTLLEPERFPLIGFTSRTLGDSNGQMWLLGDLTLHGVTRPVRLTLAVQQKDQGPDGAEGFAVLGRARIRRSDFGMPQMHGLVGDQVDLTVQAQFTRTIAPEASSEPLQDRGASNDLE